MTTATITPAGEARVIADGWAARDRALLADWSGQGDEIRAALGGLTEALELYEAIRDHLIHPASAYFELADEDEAYHRALEMAAQDAGEWTAELSRLLPELNEGERGA